MWEESNFRNINFYRNDLLHVSLLFIVSGKCALGSQLSTVKYFCLWNCDLERYSLGQLAELTGQMVWFAMALVFGAHLWVFAWADVLLEYTFQSSSMEVVTISSTTDGHMHPKTWYIFWINLLFGFHYTSQSKERSLWGY